MALGAVTDTTNGESLVVELLASATAANGAPSSASAGIKTSLLRRNGRKPDQIRVGVMSTAGSGTMTVALRLWGYTGVGWVVAKALNASSAAPHTAVAIPETGTNAIAYSEVVDGIACYSRLYLEITTAPGGDSLTKASLDLDTVTTGTMDTEIEATTGGTAGNSITIALTHSAGAANEGTLARVGNAFTFTYKGGTTTVANFETAVAALAGADDLIGVKVGGTGGNILHTTNDVLAATPLAGGLDLTAVTGYAIVG